MPTELRTIGRRIVRRATVGVAAGDPDHERHAGLCEAVVVCRKVSVWVGYFEVSRDKSGAGIYIQEPHSGGGEQQL